MAKSCRISDWIHWPQTAIQFIDRRIVFLCCLTLVAGCDDLGTGLPGASVPARQGPVLTVDRLQHEFPDSQEEVLSTQFLLSNAGGQNLEILDIKTSCGCAVGEAPEKLLKPGQSTSMLVHVNRPAAGVKNVIVTISTNSQTTPALSLELLIRSLSDDSRIVDVSQNRLIFPVPSTTGNSQRITYKTIEKKAEKFIESVSCNLPFIAVKLVDLREDVLTSSNEHVNREYVFELVVLESKTPGQFFGQLKVNSATGQAFPPVNVEIQIRSPLWTTPKTLLANIDATGQLPSWRVKVDSQPTKERYELDLIPSDCPWLEVTLHSHNAAEHGLETEETTQVGELTVRVTSPPPTFPARTTIQIHTTNKDCPLLEIPVVLLSGVMTPATHNDLHLSSIGLAHKSSLLAQVVCLKSPLPANIRTAHAVRSPACRRIFGCLLSRGLRERTTEYALRGFAVSSCRCHDASNDFLSGTAAAAGRGAAGLGPGE